MSGAEQLRAELEAMKTTALRKRALEDGADEEGADDAFESDDPKAALVQLILDLQDMSPSKRPGNAARQAAAEAEAAAEREREAENERMRREIAAEGLAGAIQCSWKIICNVVLVAGALITVLAGALCKTDIVAGPCEAETTGTFIIVTGLHFCLPAFWTIAGEYFPDKRKELVSRDNKLLTVGSFFVVYAIILGSLGIACRADALLGHTDCRASGFWLCLSAFVMMNPAFLVVLGWTVRNHKKKLWLKEDDSRDPQEYTDSAGALSQWKSVRLAGGPFFFGEGLILSIFGGLCIEDFIPGVDNCMGDWSELPLGIAGDMGSGMNIWGAAMFIPGLFATGYTFMDGGHSCGFIIGYWMCVAGFVPLGIGGACIGKITALHCVVFQCFATVLPPFLRLILVVVIVVFVCTADHLYDLQASDGGSQWVDCSYVTDVGRSNRGMAVSYVMGSIVVAFTGLCTLAYWRKPVRERFGKIKFTLPFIIGIFLFIGGVTSTYYGWACMESLILHCKPMPAVTLLSVGPSMIVIGLYCVFICYFWWYPGMERGEAYNQEKEKNNGRHLEDGSATIREKWMPCIMGLLLIVTSIVLLNKGVMALVTSDRGSMDHNVGIINTTLGAMMLFVGANFLATALFRRNQVKVLRCFYAVFTLFFFCFMLIAK